MSAFSIRTRPFRLDWADYRALGLNAFRRTFTSLPIASAGLFIYVGMPLLMGLPGLRDGNLKAYLCYQAAALGLFVFGLLTAPLLLWLEIRGNPILRGERLMLFDDGAVRLVGPGFDVRQSWDAFGRVSRGRDHVFLFMRDAKAYVIPKRALSAPGDAQRLVTCARAAIHVAAKRQSPLSPIPEAPDNRELWLTRPYRMTFRLIFARLQGLMWPMAVASIGVVCLTLATDAWTGGYGPLHDVLGGLGSLAMTILFCLALLPVAGLIVRRRPYFRGDRTFCFTRDHIRHTSPAFDGRFDWDMVRHVRRVPGVFIFRLATGQFTVPVSAFASSAQAEAFFTQAVAFWRAAEARREFRP